MDCQSCTGYVCGAKSCVRVNNSYSDEFSVNVGVHQGSVLSPLLFIIVLEALSREFRVGCPWELLYADDLVLVAETLDELMIKLERWKTGVESKGLKVNMEKTKVMISGKELNSLVKAGKFPCGVCLKGVGQNSIFCGSCSFWIHKKCTGITGKLRENPDFKCKRCLGVARPIDSRPCKEVILGENELKVVDTFVYLGDDICSGGGCERATVSRVRSAWAKFRELLPVLTCKAISLQTRGHVYNSCVRATMLHASECWATRKGDLNRLLRNHRSMMLWICEARKKDKIRTECLLEKLCLQSLESKLRNNRLRWFGHVQRSCAGLVMCSEAATGLKNAPP